MAAAREVAAVGITVLVAMFLAVGVAEIAGEPIGEWLGAATYLTIVAAASWRRL